MDKVMLSLCMIARNESGRIDRCLASAREFADEIIVVDTGSTDDTPAIARRMGAKVIEEPWQDDFSLHRNTSLAHAQGQWILFLDCDEELAPGSGQAIRQAIAEGAYEAFLLPVVNQVNGGKGGMTAYSIRLFRNAGYRFRGRIHEQIAVEIIDRKGHEAVGQLEAPILHCGYDGDQVNIPAKIRRNLAILERYPEEERDGFFFFNLGNEYYRLGKLKEALESFEQALRLTNPAKAYGPALVKRVATLLLDLKRYQDAIAKIDYYLKIYPQFSDLVFLKGLALGSSGRYSRAVQVLRGCQTMAAPPPLFPLERVMAGAEASEHEANFARLAVGEAAQGLTACIIGRNGSPGLRECIRSVAEIARQVVYVDLGSTDNSPFVAGQMGAEVHSFTWSGDLADAWNFALGKASQPWILLMNSEETLAEEGAATLVRQLGDGETDAFRLRVRTFLDGRKSLDHCLDRPCVRLVRNQGYRFRSGKGEDRGGTFAEQGAKVGSLDILLLHNPHLVPRGLANGSGASQQDIPGGEGGKECFGTYRSAGLSACHEGRWEEGVRLLEKIPKNQRDADVWLYLPLALFHSGHYTEARALLGEGCSRFPKWTELVYLRGLAAIGGGEAAEARIWFEKCLAMGQTPWDSHVTIPGAGTYKAWLAVGQAAIRLGDHDVAIAAFLAAARYPQTRKGVVQGLAFLSDHLPEPLPAYLDNQGFSSCQDLAAAAQVLAGQRKWPEALAMLKKTLERTSFDEGLPDLSPLIDGIRTLVAVLQRTLAEGAKGKEPSRPMP